MSHNNKATYLATQQNRLSNKQRNRSNQSRKKLLEATVYIIQTYGMSQLNVRAICDQAGLSTGAFYHLFDSKEDVINYYLSYAFQKFMDEAEFETDQLCAIEKICTMYNYMTKCYVSVGYEFMTAFYTPTNKILNYKNRSKEGPLVLEKAEDYLREGQIDGTIRKDIDIDDAILSIGTIVTGLMFYWCVFKGDFDVVKKVDQKLRAYLSTISLS